MSVEQQRCHLGVPLDAEPVVGRGAEITKVADLVRRERLVSLTGMGGIGKSRLAKAVAADVQDGFADGVRFIDLSAAGDGVYVGQTIRDGVTDTNPASLTEFLEEAHLLLVIDNCEGVISDLIEFIDAIVSWCPGVHILTTTRWAMAVPGEQVFEVGPLSTSLREAESGVSEAAALFVQRSHAVIGVVDETQRPAVEDLVRQLDGIPLAIELAASRTRTMTPTEILDRLDDRFELLRANPAPRSRRHQSLQTLLDWTWSQCDAAEQRLWAAFSVFAGPVSIEAIAAVVEFDDDVALIDTVDRLVWRSLIVPRRGHRSTQYDMLQTARAYGRLRLGSTASTDTVPIEGLRRYHHRYYHGLATTISDNWFGPGQPEARATLESMIADFRAAFEWALGRQERYTDAEALFAALWPHWIAGGHLDEGRLWASRLVGAVRPDAPPHSAALWVRGWIELLSGHVAEAEVTLAKCREVALDVGEPHDAYMALGMLGGCLVLRDRYDEAMSVLDEAVSHARYHCDAWGRAMLLEVQAEICSVHGDLDRATTLCDESEQLCVDHDEVWCHALILWVRSIILYNQSEFDAALTTAGRALSMKSATTDLLGVALTGEVVAWSVASQGRFLEAALLLGITGTYWNRSGSTLIGLKMLTAHREKCLRDIGHAVGQDNLEAELERGTTKSLMDIESLLASWSDQPAATTHDPRSAAPSTAITATTRLDELTVREHEIADLVATGKTNQEIADTLFIGRRTVETHVAHILSKLGLSRRTQVAYLLAHTPSQQ